MRLLRKGNNSVVDPKRVILLRQIEDTSHVVLVKEIQGFIQCVRLNCYSKDVLANGLFCKNCFSHIKTDRYQQTF